MINLLQTDIDIDSAKNTHYSFFKSYVIKRLTGVDSGGFKTHFPNRENRFKSTNFNQLVAFVNNGNTLEEILNGTPDTLITKHNELITLIDNLYAPNSFTSYLATAKDNRSALGDIHKFVEDIKAVFNYNWFNGLEPSEDYSPYKLSENLKVRSCIFCNRTYTITRTSKSKGKLMRPQLDHWYPKSKYPLLAISFFNLIPCCSYCNSSVKGDNELNPIIHIHPYIQEATPDDFRFGYYYENSINDYVIYLKKSLTASGKAVRTLRKLKIDQMYNGHIMELEDLIKIKKAYSIEYIKKMADFFPENGLSERETFRILFGVENEIKNFHLMPMSKFKLDILEQLEMIKK